MPKAEKGTPKDIANKIKAKGLQKLKWYCQMCQKQCRDENGFKCHSASDSHLRQMKIFAGNSDGLLDDFSKDFEKMYMDILRRRHGTSRVNANNVYQEVIQDKDHIHMNATKWTTLTEFAQHLGKTGQCVVDETERGWYVSYIERDSSILKRQEMQKRKVEADRREEIRIQKQMEIQRVEAAKAYERATNNGCLETRASNMEERDKEIKLSIIGSSSTGTKKKTVGPKKSVLLEEEEDDDEDDEEGDIKNSKGRKSRWGHKDIILPHNDKKTSDKERKRTYKEDGRPPPEESKKVKRQKHDDDNLRKDYWLCRDIMVRIISKKLAKGKYYKRKAVVDKVIDKFTAEIQVLDSGPDERDGGDIIQIDQEDLETVVPKESKSVKILNGPGRHKKARVLKLDKNRYLATLEMEDGQVLERVDYGDFSKIY